MKIDSIILTDDTTIGCYKQIASVIGKWGHPYFQKLGKAMNIWIGLFSGEVTTDQSKEDEDAKSASQLLSYINGQEKSKEEEINTETENLLEFLQKKSKNGDLDPKEQTDPDAEVIVNVVDDEENTTKPVDQPFVSAPKKLKLIKSDPSQGFIPRKK